MDALIFTLSSFEAGIIFAIPGVDSTSIAELSLSHVMGVPALVCVSMGKSNTVVVGGFLTSISPDAEYVLTSSIAHTSPPAETAAESVTIAKELILVSFLLKGMVLIKTSSI